MKKLLGCVLVAAVAWAILHATTLLADTFPAGIKDNTGGVGNSGGLVPLRRLLLANRADATVLSNPTSLTSFDVNFALAANAVRNPDCTFALEVAGTYNHPLNQQDNIQLAILLDGAGGNTIILTPAMHITGNVTGCSWWMNCSFVPRTVGSGGTVYADCLTQLASTTDGVTPSVNITSTVADPNMDWTTLKTLRVQAKFGTSNVNQEITMNKFRLYVEEK